MLRWRNSSARIRSFITTSGCVLLMLLLASGARADDKKKDNPDELKARIAREDNPIKLAELRLRLAGVRLDEARAKYDAGQDTEGLATLKEMQSLVESVEQGLFGTGRDPRKKPKGFKDTEITLREMQRRMQDLLMSVPLEDRAPIEEIKKRIADIQEEFLYGIMRVKDPDTRAEAAKEVKR